ncbi:hypothetical protein ACXR2U_17100 [Jatrophihabitans sp. YIM 134969]
MPLHTPLCRVLAAVALPLVAAVTLTACGGSDPAPAPTTSAAPSSATPTSAAPSTPSTTAATTSAPSSSPTAPLTTAAPPAGGDPGTKAPVPIASAATFTPGLTATVITIEPITTTASLPGEIAGPGVRLTLAIQNRSSSPLDLGNVTVDLQDSSGSSATPLTGNGSKPFTGTAAPGGSATGVYVFTLPVDDRSGVRLYVTSKASLPVVVFTGDLG